MMMTETLLAICDLAELPPIIPPWPFVQVEPAWPVRVQSWPPVEVGMIIDPDDPWSEVHLAVSGGMS